LILCGAGLIVFSRLLGEHQRDMYATCRDRVPPLFRSVYEYLASGHADHAQNQRKLAVIGVILMGGGLMLIAGEPLIYLSGPR
jgi:hypothetical protein